MKSGNEIAHNNAINSDSKKRRSFVASLFAASYGERSAERQRYALRLGFDELALGGGGAAK